MFVKKFFGNSLAEIQEKIYQEMGPDALIMNTRETETKANQTQYEVIAAIERKDTANEDIQALEDLKKKLIKNAGEATDSEPHVTRSKGSY